MAWHGTAQHGIPQHSTAQHSRLYSNREADLQSVGKSSRHVVVVEAHDNTVDQHDADNESVEPGVGNDLPSQLSVPPELIPWN